MYKHSFWKWWSRGENRGDSECLHLFFISFPLAAGVEGCQFLTKELSPHPWQWKCRVLTTGPPRNSHFSLFKRTEKSWDTGKMLGHSREREAIFLFSGWKGRKRDGGRAESGVVFCAASQLETQRGATAPEKGSLQAWCWWTVIDHQRANKEPDLKDPHWQPV